MVYNFIKLGNLVLNLVSTLRELGDSPRLSFEWLVLAFCLAPCLNSSSLSLPSRLILFSPHVSPYLT